MTTQSRVTEEPFLAVRTGSSPARSTSTRVTAAILGLLALAGVLTLAVSGNLTLPFKQVVALEGGMGAQADFFADPEIERILMKHHLTLVITRTGSRVVAVNDLDRYDFLVTSGQPAGDLVQQRRQQADQFVKVSRPFVTPLVFATYRPYARALERAGIITAQPAAGRPSSGRTAVGQPLYYTLQVDAFLAAVNRRARWSDPEFDISAFGVRNGNEVLAQTSDPCTSNRGQSYIGLLAYVLNGNQAPVGPMVDRVSALIKPILAREGMPPADGFGTFIDKEGAAIAPLIVSYEHEYLAYQLDYRAEHGHPDDERVLLYPTPGQISVPQFLALNPAAERLAGLVSTDPELRKRAVQLGMRLLDRHSQDRQTQELPAFLAAQGLAPPSFTADSSGALLPPLSVLEQMTQAVAGCKNATGS